MNPLPLGYVKPIEIRFNGKQQVIWETDDLAELKQDVPDARYWCAEYSYYETTSHYGTGETEKEDLNIWEVTND